jgi:hypothetical protein
MSYTDAADIYLGDVSSQVYEFLYRPRPCLFLNSHGIPWQGDPNFKHWTAGPVIDSPAQLAQGLRQAIDTHTTQYLPIQQSLRETSFDITDTPPSERAAEALLKFMDRKGLSQRVKHGIAA